MNIPAESFCDAAIGVDNYDGMSKAVRLLKSLGHQRIAFVVDYIPDDMVYSTSQRMEAFLEAAEQNGYDDEYAYVITADEHDAPLSKADLAAQLVAKLLSLPHMPTPSVPKPIKWQSQSSRNSASNNCMFLKISPS